MSRLLLSLGVALGLVRPVSALPPLFKFERPTRYAVTGIPDVRNVLDYGADPGGVADSATGINAATADAEANGGGVVFFPCGTYLIKRAILLGDNVTLQGSGLCTIVQRDATVSAEPAYDTSCVKIRDEMQRAAIRNSKKDCGNVGITIRDLAIDGSLITTLPCASCTAGPTNPSVMLVLAAVDDLLIDHVAVRNAPQDGIYVKNGGGRTVIRAATLDGFNMHWGNGSGINVEMHTTANKPGYPEFVDNYIVAKGPQFCDTNLSVACDADADCPSGVCGNGAGAAGVNGISLTFADAGGTHPAGIIARNRMELSDRHTGISCSGCSGVVIGDNWITSYDSGTRLRKAFLGIQVVGARGKSFSDVIVHDNVILGASVANDKRGILVDDSSSSSARVVVHHNIVRNKALAAGQEAITVRGVADSAVDGNVVQNVTAQHGIGVGGTSSTTADVRVSGNEVTDVTAANAACVVLRGATRTVLEGNTFRDCSRGIELQAGTIAGTVVGRNAYASVTTPLKLTVTDTALGLFDPLGLSYSRATLPAAVVGSIVRCTDCDSAAPCASPGRGRTAHRDNEAVPQWSCD